MAHRARPYSVARRELLFQRQRAETTALAVHDVMFERDYFLRLLKQLSALLAAILKLKREEKLDAALEQLQGAFPPFFGIEYRTLVGFDSASVAQLLVDSTRIKILAQLLEEEADIHRRRGDVQLSAAKQLHALELYIEAAQRNPADSEVSAAILRLSSRAELTDLGERYCQWLRSHPEIGARR